MTNFPVLRLWITLGRSTMLPAARSSSGSSFTTGRTMPSSFQL